MKNIVLIILVILGITACKNKQLGNPKVEIITEFGAIEMELYPQQAPKSVAAFLSYVNSEFYNRSSFYRVLNQENQPMGASDAALIQGGLWANKEKNPAKIPTIEHETTKQTGLLHKDGTVSLARGAPGTASTEFFICIGDQPAFDFGGGSNGDNQGYAAFGKVIKGMDIVRKIHHQPVDGELFSSPVFIKEINRL